MHTITLYYVHIIAPPWMDKPWWLCVPYTQTLGSGANKRPPGLLCRRRTIRGQHGLRCRNILHLHVTNDANAPRVNGVRWTQAHTNAISDIHIRHRTLKTAGHDSATCVPTVARRVRLSRCVLKGSGGLQAYQAHQVIKPSLESSKEQFGQGQRLESLHGT
jgi:hypothetical protein